MSGRVLSAGEGPVSTWSVPNLITILRILLVPLFVWLALADGGADGPLRWIAAAVFVFAIATDSIDGHLARSRNLITDLGKLLDPIADKAITGSALIVLAVLGELPWWVAALILLRELGITVWRLVEAPRRVLPAGRGGKLKTLLQAIALTAALLPLWQLLGAWVHWPNTALMSAALLVTLWSGADYLWQAYRPSRRRPQPLTQARNRPAPDARALSSQQQGAADPGPARQRTEPADAVGAAEDPEAPARRDSSEEQR